jgi:hypothetical protein
VTLDAGALTTYEQIAARLGLDSACARRDVLESLINEVSAEFAALANRELQYAPVADPAVEIIEARGGRDLFVRRAPIVSVSLVEHLSPSSGTALETITDFYLDQQLGCLHRPQGWSDDRVAVGIESVSQFAPRSLRVTYVGGYITPYQASADWPGGTLGTRSLPADIEAVVIRAVVSASTRVGQDANVSSGTNANVSRFWGDAVQQDLRRVAQRYNRGR